MVPPTTQADEVLDTVAEILATVTGLRLPSGSQGILRDAVAVRAGRRTRGDGPAYLDVLRSLVGREEASELFDRVCVGQTELFRHPALFDALSLRVLRQLWGVSRTRTIRIWSAGCSTGEETWSLAATARETLGPDAFLDVCGSDLSRPALRAAESGSYDMRAAARIPEKYRFLFELASRCRPSPQLREVTRFARCNLTADPPPFAEPVDAIFFCNVAIYFTQDVVADVVSRLGEALRPGGFLFLGRAESLWGLPHTLELVDLGRVFAYRRPLAAARQPQSPRAGGRPSPPKAGRPPATKVELAEAVSAVQGHVIIGDLAAAAAGAEAVIEADSFQPAGYYLRGAIAERKRDDVTALAEFDRAIYLDPGFAMAHVHRAGVFERRGDARRASAAYAAAAQALTRDISYCDVFLESMSAVTLARTCAERSILLRH